MTIVTTGDITIADLNDGLNAYLTQEACVIATNTDGSGGNYTIANTTMVVRQGTADVSSQWTVTAAPSTGVTGSLSTRTYSVSAMSVDTGYVDLTASKQGETPITLRFTISKAKKGDQGVTGDRGTIATSRTINGEAWSDTEAAAAIAAAGGGSPMRGDVVHLKSSTTNWTQTRVRTTGGTWAILAQFFGGDVLVDGTVVGTKLVAETITGNLIQGGAIEAIHLQAGSILASKLTVTDFTNLVPDPSFKELGTTWFNGAGTASVINAPNSDWLSPTLLSVATGYVWRAHWSQPFPVEPGRQLYYQQQAQRVLGTGNITCQIQFSETANFSSVLGTAISLVFNSGSLELKNIIAPVPANARYGRIRFVSPETVSECLIGHPIVRIAANGELIVDGEITTSKLAAGAVSAEKIQAGSVLASKLAVSDFTNLVPDSAMKDLGAWELPEFFELRPAGHIRYNYASGSSSGSTPYVNSKAFGVVAGKSYRFEYTTWGFDGTVTYRVDGGVLWYDNAGSQIGGEDLIDTSVTSGYKAWAKDLTAPTGAVTAIMRWRVNRGWSTGSSHISSPSCRLRMGGELIVDGVIKANHLITSEAVIEHTAQIKNAIITNAKIADLSAAKLTAGTALASTITVDGRSLATMASSDKHFDVMATDWTQVSGPGTGIYSDTDGHLTGTRGLKLWADGAQQWRAEEAIPFNPTKLYRVSFLVKRILSGSVGTMSLGLELLNENKTLVGTARVAANAVGQHTVPNTLTEYVGYVKGTSSGASVLNDRTISNPATLYDLVRFIRPVAFTNEGRTSDGARIFIDSVSIEVMPEEVAELVNRGTTQIDPGKIVISGGTSLADWRRAGDQTKIDGGSISANTIDANKLTIGNRGVTVSGVSFDYNSPGANQVSWTAGKISWINDAGTATETSISAGSATWTSGILYIYFDKTGTLKTTTSVATAMGLNCVIIATYEGGSKLISDYGKTVIDGASIKTGTITSEQIKTDSAVITGSAQIANGIITNAKIGSTIQSNNFVTGSTGWRIQKSGAAEFNGPVISRQIMTDSGFFTLPTLIDCGYAPMANVATYWIETNTMAEAWVGTNETFLALVGRRVGANYGAVSSNPDFAAASPELIQWGWEAVPVSLTRWSGNQRVWIKVNLWAQYVTTMTNFQLEWKLIKVT